MPEEANRNGKITGPKLPVGLRRIIIGAGFCLLAVVAIATFHPSLNERWKFGTDMALNVLILLAIAVQAYIYSGQWKAMRESLERTDKVIEKMEAQTKIAEQNARIALEETRPFLKVTARVVRSDLVPEVFASFDNSGVSKATVFAEYVLNISASERKV